MPVSDQSSVVYLHRKVSVELNGWSHSNEIANLHLTALRTDIGKRVQDMRQILDGEVLRIVLAPVRGPVLQSVGL